MNRAPLVVAGTVAGVGAVLAFPVHSSLSAAASSNSSSTGSGTTAASAATPTAAPATDASSAPTSSPTTSTTSPSAGTRSATGADEAFRYGNVAVTVTVNGSKITAVKVSSLSETDPRSASIDSYAIPQLEQQVISADSANIQGVSGATFTSEAFAQSLASALAKLGFS